MTWEHLLRCVFMLAWLLAAKSAFDCKHHLWMHVPKTGSSFCMTLQHMCCREEFERLTDGITNDMLKDNDLRSPAERSFGIDFAYGCAIFRKGKHRTCQMGGPHTPLAVDVDASEVSLLAMFRDPKKRIISAFLDSMHHEGMPPEDFTALSEQIAALGDDNNGFDRLIARAQLFASNQNNIGCQVKMLNGHECSSPLFKNQPFNNTALQYAVHRLQEFCFVGLTDSFDLSVRLFHAMANQSTTPNPVELYAARTSRVDKSEALQRHVVFDDPYDSVLYGEAKRLFQTRLAIYGVHPEESGT